MRISILLAGLLAFTACAGGSEKSDTEASDTDASETDTPSDTDATDTEALDGGELFSTHCSSCHGSDGTGTGNGPNIVGEVSRHSDEDIIDVILNGEDRMPAIEVTEEEAQLIVDWMRENF